MIWKKSTGPAIDDRAKTNGLTSPAAPTVAETKTSTGLQDVSFSRKAPSTEPSVANLQADSKGDSQGGDLDSTLLTKRAAAAKAMFASLGEITTVLMKSKDHQNHTLAELQDILIPALVAGQVAVASAQSKASGFVAPAGIVLWASVSPAVDARLSATPHQLVKLSQQDRTSGDIIWITLAVGDRRVLQNLISRLQTTNWNNKSAKIVTQTSEGKAVIAEIAVKAA